MYIVIAGGGKVGFYLAQELLESGHEVLVVEESGDRVASLADELPDAIIQGDACEVATLDKAGVARADLVAAVTGDDEDNLVICDVSRVRGVPRTIARINNPRNSQLFESRGVETTVSATQAILAQIEQELPITQMVPVMQLHEGLELVEVKLSETSPAVGRTARDVLLPPEALIALIVDQGGSPRVPSADSRLNPGDALVVVVRSDTRDALKEALIGATHGLDT
jgi:trk system potassium uptake protein TrkA